MDAKRYETLRARREEVLKRSRQTVERNAEHLDAFVERNATKRVATGPGGLRVLVVDDNADATEVLALALRLLGHEAEAATSGEQALALCEWFVPDAAFVDLAMEGMNGYELARRLKSMHRSVRIFALTGVNPSHWRVDENLETHLLKPISIKTALDILEGPCRRAPHHSASQMNGAAALIARSHLAPSIFPRLAPETSSQGRDRQE